MIKKRLVSTSFFLFLIVWVAACGGGETAVIVELSPQPTETAVATEMVAPTETAVSTNTPVPQPTTISTPVPTQEPISTATVVPISHAGSGIEFEGIQFTLNPNLTETVYSVDGQEPYEMATFLFADPGDLEDPTSICWRQRVGCITVYDLEAYAADFEVFAYVVDLTQAAIEHQEVVEFPTIGAAILMQTQVRLLNFQNGSGFRGIVVRGQDGFLANNDAIVYAFYGITDDGRTYINATIPLHWLHLIDTADPAANMNEYAILPPELPDDFVQSRGLIAEYNRSLEPLMDVAADSEFSPDLSVLDALFASLLISLDGE